MKQKSGLKEGLCILLACLGMQNLEAKSPKWLVLEPITYQTGVSKTAFQGIDQLLLTKFAQANKYKCLDRKAYDTAAQNEGFGGEANLIPAGYSVCGEIVEIKQTGSRVFRQRQMTDYLATVSIRVNELRTQVPYIGITKRIEASCFSQKDLLVTIVNTIVREVLFKEFPVRILADEGGSLILNYGSDFLKEGESFEICHRYALKDDDSGSELFSDRVSGLCQVTSPGENTSEAVLVEGSAKVGDVLHLSSPERRTSSSEKPQLAVSTRPQRSSTPIRKPYVKKFRLAVLPFHCRYDQFSLYGETIACKSWLDLVEEDLNSRFVQTGKFTVLDRKNDAGIDKELARITGDANASPKDIIRLNRKLATDYLLLGEVFFHSIAAPEKNPFTGMPLPQGSAVFAEVKYRLVHAPTGRIRCADSVRLDISMFQARDVRGIVTASTDMASLAIVDAVVARTLPFEIVGSTGDLVVIGEGGKALVPGERLLVFALGEPIKDTRTGEALDQLETYVGKVEVIDVKEKTSYARILEGDLRSMPVGSRLRRYASEMEPQQAPEPESASPVKLLPSGGVVVPF